MYAQLCKRLSEEAPNFESPNNPCTFRLLLLNKCRDEFENRSKASEAFEHRDGPLAPDEEEHRQLAKRKMLGNIKFIGELGKLEILHESILYKCCVQLLEKRRRRGGTRDMAEDLECLCQIMKTCGRILDTEKGKSLMNQYFDRMAMLAENQELPIRIRFMLRDTIELRRNKWVPRKAANTEGPTPIGQVRDDHTRDRGYGQAQTMPGSRMSGMSSGGIHSFFRNPMKTRHGLDDVLGSFPTLGTGPGVIPTQDKFHFGPNGLQSGFRHQRQQFSGQQNLYTNRQNFSQNHKQQQQNQQNQQQNFNNTGNREVAPRFKNKMMLGHQTQGSLEEVSLRPSTNSMMLKPKTQNSLGKSSLGSSGGRQPGLFNDTLLQAPQTSLLNQKPTPPLLQKEAPILIKQGSLDKNKGGKKEKGPSKEEVLKKIENLLEDYLNSKNTQEALSSYREQKVPDRFVSEVIVLILNKTLDKSENDRDLANSLMSEFKKESLLTSAQFLDSFRELLGQMAEKEQDIPRIKSYVAGYASYAITEDLVTLADVAEPMENGTHYPLFLLTLQQLHKTQGKAKLTKLFNESKVNLLSMLPEIDRNKERLAEILEDRALNFLFPLLRIQSELWKQLQADPNPAQFYKWIKENLDASHYSAPGFINALMTVLVRYITQESTLADGTDQNSVPDKAVQEKEKILLEKFKPVLQAFLHEHINLQVIAVYALQVYCYTMHFPKGMLLRWFVNLYDLEVVEEEAFLKWKEDVTDDYPGKGKALFQVNQWLTWLAEAESEEEEEGDN